MSFESVRPEMIDTHALFNDVKDYKIKSVLYPDSTIENKFYQVGHLWYRLWYLGSILVAINMM